MEALWAIAFISAEKGLIYVKTYKESLNNQSFGDHVLQVYNRMGQHPFALFMDGASYHKEKSLTERLQQLNIESIINAPYLPEYNPIEGCFSIVKNYFKRKRLNRIINERHYSTQLLITESFSQLSKMKINNMIDHAYQKLFKIGANPNNILDQRLGLID